MNKYIVIFLSFVFSAANAEEYKCTRGVDDPQINISFLKGKSKFEYTKNSESKLFLNIPDKNIHFANKWDSGRKFIAFNPGWGESTVHIYARVSSLKDESLFDIYAKGMVSPNGAIIETLADYTCVRFTR